MGRADRHSRDTEIRGSGEHCAELKANSILWTMLRSRQRKFLKQSRRFSFGKTSRDTGVSNPPLSATQSVVFTYIPEKAANPRVDGPIRAARGTGESDQSCKSPIRAIPLCSEKIRCHEPSSRTMRL